jgi:hypothetical protein
MPVAGGWLLRGEWHGRRSEGILSEAGVERTSGARSRHRCNAAGRRRGCCAALLLTLACQGERGKSESVASEKLQRARPALEDANATRLTAVRAAEAARRELELSVVKPTQLAPGASDEFDAAVLADVQHALDAMEENAFATLVHEEKRVLPKSCRTWRALRARGYAPKNALAEQVDGGALVRCGALEFLARATPSRTSHVRDALKGAGPEALPAIVASATSKLAQRARSVAAARGMTLAEFLPGARAEQSDLKGRVLITEPASATSVTIHAEAWGDVNSDESEDLLLSVLNSSDEGSYFDMRLIVVTRTSPRGPWTVLSVQE